MMVFLLVALVALGSACAGPAPSDEPRPRPTSAVRILEYNAAGWLTLGSEPVRGARIAAQVAGIAPAIIGLSECDPCQKLIDQMPDGYELVTEGRVGVTAAYEGSLWRVRDHGFLSLGG